MLSRVEVSRAALTHNLTCFRRLAPGARLAPVVKANAYGHGLLQAAAVLAEAGADWLCVNAAFEAHALRDAGVKLPVYVLGWVAPEELGELARRGDIRIVAYDESTLRLASEQHHEGDPPLYVHIKVETGNNRQGVSAEEALRLAGLASELPGLRFEGLSSHYADIEDTTDHAFARHQLARFNAAVTMLTAAGCPPTIRNFSNSAAVILWPETHFELVRIGISTYGMWPSKETLVSAERLGRDKPSLVPALTWKTRVAQVKRIPAGEWVGYGRTWRATRETRLAVLPVGYYDGYDRKLSNLAHVLVHGAEAPVRGRVCMNMIMVDVTDIPGVETGTDVVLLGRDRDEVVTAEQLASWCGTINYEVTTRILERIPRTIVD